MLKKFLVNCRRQLTNESNLFWVALQSNVLADISNVESGFKEALEEMKNELKNNGWIFPFLAYNMRNQVNIANINVERGSKGMRRRPGVFPGSTLGMQSSVQKLNSGSCLIGELPLLFKVLDWKLQKFEVLHLCINLMMKKNDKNIVVLYDDFKVFKDVDKDIQMIIEDKTVVAYPPDKNKTGISSIRDFIEKRGYILVTHGQYFNGCEASNIIFLNNFYGGVRNCLMRGVENVICVQLKENKEKGIKGIIGETTDIKGMKEDNRFDPSYKSSYSSIPIRRLRPHLSICELNKI